MDARRLGGLAAAALLLAACGGGTATPTPAPTTGSTTGSATGSASPSPGGPSPSGAPTASPTPTPTPTPTASAAAWPAPALPAGAVTARAETVADDLDVPWGLAPLPDGRLLVSLRDAARLVVVDPASGDVADVGGPGAERLAAETVPLGEGGLLGVAVAPTGAGAGGAATPDAGVAPARDDAVTVVVYRTGADDNAVLTGALHLGGAAPRLDRLATVLDGIPSAANHDGGQVAFGPDGHLWVTTGDAGERGAAQDPGSLAGKVLRVTLDGDPAPGNPTAGSPVWSRGHRNVQGIGWDPAGRAFASEFGQDTWDELNLLVPGGDHGWPDVEGRAGGGGSPAVPGTSLPETVDGRVQPLATWATDEASPSGLAVTPDAVYLAGLRGERLWRVPFDVEPGRAPSTDPAAAPGLGEPQALLDGEHGRLRAVAAAGEGALWVLTNNTDGRGDPRAGDDRLLRVTLGPAG
ncbi:PQQ-dependent sugar dehydrogenase [Puerhibacterium sp. TATVAM-FAB25]|uniref:PQQ-dependent sugar dehydrogenase n=1 Tax=Puerhibacterium sp. TATVAM-FAB25 TaxID=3093699 RepID=UPI00397C33F2